MPPRKRTNRTKMTRGGKKSKLSIETTPTEVRQTVFEDMNDDCIREIFTYLNLDDLCAVSRLNHRLHGLAAEQFVRKYPQDQQNIQRLISMDKMLKYPGDSKYVACFSGIRKVTITSKESIPQLKLDYQHKPPKDCLNEIRFEDWNDIDGADGINLSEITGNIKSVTFAKCKIAGDFYETILKHLPSMKQLTLWKSFCVECSAEEKDKWWLKKYPKLEYFAWHLDRELDINKNVKSFFKRNKQIKRFSLLTSKIETIQKCENNGITITDLFFRVKKNPKTALEFLKEFCDDDTKRLHLWFDDETRTELSKSHRLLLSMKANIDGLFFENNIINAPLAKVIKKMTHLKVLQVRACKMIHYFVDLPELEELYIARSVVSGTFDRIRETMLQFASQSPTLKKICFRNNSQVFAKFEFEEMDNARKELEDAEKMLICVKTDESACCGTLSRINLFYDTFNITRTETNHLTNPLTNEYLYSIGACSSKYDRYLENVGNRFRRYYQYRRY